MNRKSFLGTTGALVAGLSLPWNQDAAAMMPPEDEMTFKQPPYLKTGDVIGVTSPAGPVTAEEISKAVSIMESWGYRVKIGDSIGKREFTRGGTDEERLNDFQKMLDDPSIRAVMCARGGYGSVRIIDRIDWTRFRKNPKWVIGFSDITVLHCHIHHFCHVASIHSKMLNSFPDDMTTAEPVVVQTIESIRDALAGKKNEV